MPLARYQIRNEYSLADPELYKAADRDDPEALLEGVAMAGLVGVLRQLGDLAEFAAEVFHDLHEEVMATAARGHGLMARVQQLEAEVPSIEKAFLSQTDQSPFFSNTGVDWHPNLRMEQNLVTRGDLPRFVMDSYEECRGPPRLFLLDKFDVAGAGACLKRYTDPSFFRVEAASSGILTIDVQREKKIRKVKKKGTRWRNGETTPEVPTSHAKLHQLFLEERVENAHSDPNRLVKLKRRQLNGSPFDLKPGKSYMEKFLGTPSPEHRVICEVSVNPSPPKLTFDNSCESGLEILDIGVVSPPEKSSHGRDATHSSPIAQEILLKPFAHELDGENINREIVKVPDSIAGGEGDESSYVIHKMAIKDELAIEGDEKIEGSLDGDHSDDLMSEVDNYMDALTNVESEMETDNEYKPKTNQGVLKVGRHETFSDANEDHMDVQANFSDSQSYGNSSISDDGKSSFKKGKYSVSYSDSLSNFTENTISDNEGAGKFLPSEDSTAEIVNSTSGVVETLGTQSSELLVFNNKCMQEEAISNAGKASCSSHLSDSDLQPSVPSSNSVVVSLAEAKLDEMTTDCVKLSPESPEIDQSGVGLPHSFTGSSDDTFQTMHNNMLAASSEGCLVEELDHKDPKDFVHTPKMPDFVEEDNDVSLNEALQTDLNGDGIHDENLVKGKMDSPPSVMAPSKEQFSCSVLPEIDVGSDGTLVSESVDVVKPVHRDSEVDSIIGATGVSSENPMSMVETLEADIIKEHQCSDIEVDVSQVTDGLTGVTCSDENMSLEEISGAGGNEEVGTFTSNVNVLGEDSVPFERRANYSDNVLDEHVNLDEDLGASLVTSVVATNANDGVNSAGCPSTGLVFSSSGNLVDIQETHLGNESPHQKALGFNEGVLPEFHTEPVEQKEVKQLEFAPVDSASSPHKSASDDHSNFEVLELVCESALTDQVQNCSYMGDVRAVPSAEPLDQELESCWRHSAVIGEDAGCSLTCYEPQVETSLEHFMELPVDQNSVESAHAVMDEEKSLSLILHSSPPQQLEEPGVPSEQSLGLQSDHLDTGCLQVGEASSKSADMRSGKNSASLNVQSSPACQLGEPGVLSEQSLELRSIHLNSGGLQVDEARSKSSDMQSEQIHTMSDVSWERYPDASSKQDAIPNQELLMPSASQDNDTMLSRNPFDSGFPSLGPFPQNLEEMPPLPPLPPMQWRIGKFQPALPSSQVEEIGPGEGTFLPIQPFKADEKSRSDFLSSDREIMQLPNPFVSFAEADIERSDHLYAESVENCLQPTRGSLELPTVVSDANSQQTSHSSEGTQLMNPFLTLPEITNERPEDGFLTSGGRPIGSSPDMSSAVVTAEHTSIGCDPVPSHGPPVKLLNQATPESIVEAETPEYNVQNSEGEEKNSLDKPASPPTMLEDQPQHDSETLQRETTWLPTTLALPPTYEVGKANGSKLPRPRNPLIDAVAAHDKSKLRRVTERVRPQIGPKVDERDSLLEQIRTKSFNLKPAAATRPSIQGIQGPKTNLKVAAILEKANAIRQALAGSDEDDDTDSWSDS
ncbi:hypothetical protein JCGZ_00396 [Jatropha curcas]|uniref:Protein SCAR n=1 Tax=Jatropha curcas TaxID=180498 RepID=A0A067JTE7_JATCU|nr:protein SCAR2 [Jatropha curcas]KDP22809.1 hypothetical protein JCGZ_00396 [Jatropha curcas]